MAVASTTSSGPVYVVGGDGGVAVGTAATDAVGFFGATPVVQPSGSAQAAMTAAVPIGTTGYGYSLVQATALIYFQREVTRVLTLLGLWKGNI